MTTVDPLKVGDVDLRPAVEEWARAHWRDAVSVANLAPMPGNSGLSFGFTVHDSAGRKIEAVVLRLAPPGVRRSGNTDVLRQVPLLKALDRCGIPVAPVLWHSGDPAWFGTDALAQRKLAARPFHMYDPNASVDPGPRGAARFLQQAVAVLARVHAIDWESELVGWDEPRSTVSELDRWLPLAEKAAEPEDAQAARALRDALLASAPTESAVGLFHGDFQTNNVLFHEDAVIAAVIDWELAGIGQQQLDLGWLAMMTDLGPWAPEQRARMRMHFPPEDIRAWYEHASGISCPHFDWYRALAEYRFGAIAAFNLRLHRTGRRHDPSYETMASSVRTLFDHGQKLIRDFR